MPLAVLQTVMLMEQAILGMVEVDQILMLQMGKLAVLVSLLSVLKPEV
jgi:hypothetical protein